MIGPDLDGVLIESIRALNLVLCTLCGGERTRVASMPFNGRNRTKYKEPSSKFKNKKTEDN